MKVVLFCGGLGTRLREHSDKTPKPLVNIGRRPMLWHLMKYYAHFGHREFILCLGHMKEQIEQYVTQELDADHGWNITLADTGLESSIGQRLRAVREHIGDDPEFLANYSDGLTDLPLDEYLTWFRSEDRIASFVSVRPPHSFHVVATDQGGLVSELVPAKESNIWINGGFFALKREIFDYLHQGEDLVEEPFQRLVDNQQLLAYRYRGFWASMDTYKDKKAFDAMNESGDMPWRVWIG